LAQSPARSRGTATAGDLSGKHRGRGGRSGIRHGADAAPPLPENHADVPDRVSLAFLDARAQADAVGAGTRPTSRSTYDRPSCTLRLVTGRIGKSEPLSVSFTRLSRYVQPPRFEAVLWL